MNRIKLMINGLPGNVCRIIAEHVAAAPRFHIIPWSLTGPEIAEPQIALSNGTVIQLLLPDHRDETIRDIKKDHGPFISIDYTHPTAVNANAEFYCRHALPFIMGTTGGDRDKLIQTVAGSTVAAVIAPNMAKPIVGFQAMMAYAAETFPNLFTGFSLEVRESHQKGKADTSGTAKAMITYFNKLGIPFSENDIYKERDPQKQLSVWKIPEAHLGGHGWHTYTLTSADRTFTLSFTHNVNGRDIYADGTMTAALFLAKRIEEGARGIVYSMIDVLKAG